MRCFLTFTILCTFKATFCYRGELLASVVIFRDGERTPLKSIPGDPFRAKWESIGYGQLTTYGKERMYHLGQWLRQRYDKHIPARYNKDAIFVRSIDYDEAITSAYMVLAGLFPPLEDQIFDKNLQWQPIPVHTESITNDYLLMGSFCKQVDNVERISFRSFDEDEQNDTVWMESKLNIHPNENISLIDIVESIWTAMGMDSSTNSTWINNETVEEMKDKIMEEMQLPTSTADLARLKLGPFFYEVTKYFDRFLPGAPEVEYEPKFKAIFYSGVMETLVNIINGLKVVDVLDIPHHVPRFGATLLLELRDGSAGKRYLNILYKNSTSTIRQYKINGCGLNCDYDVFVEKIKPLTAEYAQAKAECESMNQ